MLMKFHASTCTHQSLKLKSCQLRRRSRMTGGTCNLLLHVLDLRGSVLYIEDLFVSTEYRSKQDVATGKSYNVDCLSSYG